MAERKSATTAEVKNAVDAYNTAIQSIDSNLSGLDVIDELQSQSDSLKEIWTSDNGQNTVTGLNNVIRRLNEEKETITKTVNQMKSQTCTFTTTDASDTTPVVTYY